MTRIRLLFFALLLPVLLLASVAGWKSWVVVAGNRVILPIQGFDPRDLLSGHYLIYTIDYGIEGLCELGGGPAFVCLDPKAFSWAKPPAGQCRQLIRGRCDRTRFTAGIERFCIPEDRALSLDKAVRNRRGDVVLVLDGKGGAQVADLLIDGRSWQEWDDND